MYSKATQVAIAAASRLAEVYDEEGVRLSAADIADSRGLQRPFVAKILSTLAAGGVVRSVRGPGGGFILARPPEEISLHEIARLFERAYGQDICPIGGGICGTAGEPCPIHDQLSEVRRLMHAFLKETSLEGFRRAGRRRSSTSPAPRRPTPP